MVLKKPYMFRIMFYASTWISVYTHIHTYIHTYIHTHKYSTTPLSHTPMISPFIFTSTTSQHPITNCIPDNPGLTSHFYKINPSEVQNFISIPHTQLRQFTSAIQSVELTAPFSAQHYHSTDLPFQ